MNEAGVSHYSFPAPHLEPLATTDESEAADTTTADADNPGTESENEQADERTDNAGTIEIKSESETESEPTLESDESAEADSGDDPGPEPSAAVNALEQRLGEGGMTTELESDAQIIRTIKLGETYRVRPSDVLEGDGALSISAGGFLLEQLSMSVFFVTA